MRNIFRLAVLAAVLALIFAAAAPVMAAPGGEKGARGETGPPGGKIECNVVPVNGGPTDASLHDQTATVWIPANNPAIHHEGPPVPGKVFRC